MIHLPQRPPGARRIAFLADAADSTAQVLSHAARHTLATVLASLGASLEECLLISLLDGRADANTVRWQDERMQSGIARALEALEAYAPNIVVALGNDPRSPSHAALHLLKAGNIAPPSTKSGKVRWAWSTGTWRGSLFASSPNLWNTLMPSAASPLSISSVELDNSTGSNRGVTGGANSVRDAEPITNDANGHGVIAGRTEGATPSTEATLRAGSSTVERGFDDTCGNVCDGGASLQPSPPTPTIERKVCGVRLAAQSTNYASSPVAVTREQSPDDHQIAQCFSQARTGSTPDAGLPWASSNTPTNLTGEGERCESTGVTAPREARGITPSSVINPAPPAPTGHGEEVPAAPLSAVAANLCSRQSTVMKDVDGALSGQEGKKWLATMPVEPRPLAANLPPTQGAGCYNAGESSSKARAPLCSGGTCASEVRECLSPTESRKGPGLSLAPLLYAHASEVVHPSACQPGESPAVRALLDSKPVSPTRETAPGPVLKVSEWDSSIPAVQALAGQHERSAAALPYGGIMRPPIPGSLPGQAGDAGSIPAPAFLRYADKPTGILEVPVVLEERAPGQHAAITLPARAPYKCLATWHPSFINRAWSHYLFEFRSDLRRAVDEALVPTLALEQFDIAYGPSND